VTGEAPTGQDVSGREAPTGQAPTGEAPTGHDVSGQAPRGQASPAATCSRCGTCAPEQPLTWSTATGPRGTILVCDRCTREHVRSIEAKLDEEHW